MCKINWILTLDYKISNKKHKEESRSVIKTTILKGNRVVSIVRVPWATPRDVIPRGENKCENKCIDNF